MTAVLEPDSTTEIRRSLGCAGCGDCCNPVGIDIETADSLLAYWRFRANGGRKPRRKTFNESYEFAAKHWNEISRSHSWVKIRCDAYDPETKSCTAYDDRPPVCSGFPWYGQTEPGQLAERAAHINRRCSFLLDLPPADRGPDARPLIPITEVTR